MALDFDESTDKRLGSAFSSALQSGSLDDVTIKDIKLRAVKEAERVIANDQKASIISVVVYIVVT